jgi:hypothetical protein
MKLLFMVLGLSMMSIGPWAQRAPSPLPVLIEKYKVGNVVIGASAEDVYEAFSPGRRRLVDLGHEGQLSPALELTIAGSSRPFSVIAELTCDQGLVVSRLFIKDPAFRTAKGVGVGSTVRELRSAYSLGSFSTEEGGAGVVVDALSATFELDQTGVDLLKIKAATGLPDSVKVVGILLWK